MCIYILHYIYVGFGSGTNKWIVFFNGGAWCFDEEACYQRSQTAYGSSRFEPMFTEGGLYSNNSPTNPSFYNWNMVFVFYCDGSSFTGMRQNPVYFKDKPVYFRGKAVLDALLQDLLSRGVGNATDVLLSGSSAGSLAVLIHADFIKSKLNPKTKVRAIADSGYFVDLATQYGINKTRDMFNRMLLTHNSSSALHPACIKRTPVAEHWKCFFPQYFLDLVQTPIFVLQSAYDIWQVVNNLDVVCTIPSYEDILLFRSLKMRTSHDPEVPSSRNSPRGATEGSRVTRWDLLRDSRKNGSKSRKGDGREKRNLMSMKNAQWYQVPRHQQRNYLAPRVQRVNYQVPRVQQLNYLAPRVQRVNYQVPRVQRVNTVGLEKKGYVTFANARVLTSRPVWRRPEWRNSSGNTSGTRNNPAGSRGPMDAVRRGKTQKPSNRGWHWQSLYSVPTTCTKEETEKILTLRNLTIEALKPVMTKPHAGLFLSPCFEHTQAVYSSIWRITKVKGKTLGDAVAEWYHERPDNHIHIGQEFEFSTCI